MDKSPKPVSNIAPFGLRMQPALREKVQLAAEKNARSLNQEIIARLEASFDPSKVSAGVMDPLNLPAAPLPNTWEESFRKIVSEEVEQIVSKERASLFRAGSELDSYELRLAEEQIKSASREAQALALAVAFVDFYPLVSAWLDSSPQPQQELTSSLQTGMAAVKEFVGSFNLEDVWVWETISSGERVVLNPRFPDIEKRTMDPETSEKTIQQLEITIAQIKEFLAKNRK